MGFEPTTFCMASRRAGESAPLGEREKPLVAGKPLGPVRVGLAAFETKSETTGASVGGAGLVGHRPARRASARPIRDRVPTLWYAKRLAAEHMQLRRNGSGVSAGRVTSPAKASWRR
jgi:hypothetical protein